jgi:Flp pilus assembly protein TadD
MRSADSLWRSSLAGALVVLVSGCASLSEPLKAIQQTVMAPLSKEAVAPAPAASAATTAPIVVAPVAPKVELPPVNAAAQRSFDEARRALAAGRTQDAERSFRALVQSNPELGGPHANLGLIHRQAGRLPEAATELELAVKASPDQPLYLNQLGITYRHQGQFTKAREAYEKAIALDAGYAAPRLNLAILFDLYLRDNQQALAQYEQYQALSAGKDATVTKWIADLKNRKGDKQTLLTKKELP